MPASRGAAVPSLALPDPGTRLGTTLGPVPGGGNTAAAGAGRIVLGRRQNASWGFYDNVPPVLGHLSQKKIEGARAGSAPFRFYPPTTTPLFRGPN